MGKGLWLGRAPAFLLICLGAAAAGFVLAHFRITISDEPERSIIRTLGLLPRLIALCAMLPLLVTRLGLGSKPRR
jgi:hypothetical protein